MSLSRSQLAIIHVARRQLEMSDIEYRGLLVHVAGVESAKQLDRDGFHAVMGMMEYLGFAPHHGKGPDYGVRRGMASYAQLELIRQLWQEWADGRDGDGLSAWLSKYWKVTSLRFVTKSQAQRIITALKAMKIRAA